jgi:serine/threonine-protein kinase
MDSGSGIGGPGGSRTPADDTVVARMLIEQRLVTASEIESCKIHQQELLDDEGIKVPLSDMLVQKGYVTLTQITRLGQSNMEDSMSKPAQQIPGYQILGKLGAGAMAAVYKAKQLRLDRTVAIKVLPKRLSENPEFVKRFYQEGRAAAKLNHVNIVQAIDVGEASGYHYFVMEYIDGHTVYDRLYSDKPYTEKDGIDIIVQVARALDHAHSRGFIHRDVKPKNIMITKDGVVKLADMGLAREMDDLVAAKAEAGRAYGTPYYISPEQIRGEVDINARADIYSLGATFYHMVTRRLPFEGPTPSAVMHKHLKEALIPPDHINTNLSSGVGEIIEVMMAKDQRKRYATAKDLLIDLEAVAAGGAPLQARKNLDPDVLLGLAEGGETVDIPSPVTAEPEGIDLPRWAWLVFGLIIVLLFLSLIINIILVAKGG